MTNRRVLGKEVYSVGRSDEHFADFFVDSDDKGVIGHTAQSQTNITLYRWGFQILCPVYGSFAEGNGQCNIAMGYETKEPYAEWNSRNAPETELFELFRTVHLSNTQLRGKATIELVDRICRRFSGEDGKNIGVEVDVLRRRLIDNLLG